MTMKIKSTKKGRGVTSAQMPASTKQVADTKTQAEIELGNRLNELREKHGNLSTYLATLAIQQETQCRKVADSSKPLAFYRHGRKEAGYCNT